MSACKNTAKSVAANGMWYIDLEWSSYLTPLSSCFFKLEAIDSYRVYIGDKSSSEAKGRENIDLLSNVGSTTKKCTPNNGLYLPSLQ